MINYCLGLQRICYLVKDRRVGGREGCKKREKGRMQGIRNKRKGVVRWGERRREVDGGKKVQINKVFGK